MKFIKYIALIFTLAVALLSLPSCNKASHNGKLDGQWQIMSIEEVSTGEVSVPANQSYICINLHIIQLTGNGIMSGNMSYDKKGGTLSCDFPYVKPENVNNQLGRYGIFSNPVTLDIVKLDGKALVLKTDRTFITCR